MSIRDRGKRKWAPAFMMPESRSFKSKLMHDYYAESKPLLDECQVEEFDNTIGEAMEYHLPTVLTTWSDGYTYETKGYIHYLDPLAKEVQMVTEDGGIERKKFVDIIDIVIMED